MLEVILQWTKILSGGGGSRNTSHHRNWDKHRPDGPLGSYAYFTSTSECCCLPLFQIECSCKMFHMKITWFSWEWTNRCHTLVLHKNFCRRGKSQLGIGLFIHELPQEAFEFFWLPRFGYLNENLAKILQSHQPKPCYGSSQDLTTFCRGKD